jgi:1-acyl-sn-glycerol-3-phosphate acyltransferase
MQAPEAFQGWSLTDRDPQVIQLLMPKWEWVYQYYFRVQTSGWHYIPDQGPVLFVGSHNGGLASPDLPMFMVDWFRRFGYERPIYGLMHAGVWQVSPAAAALAAQVGALQAHPKMGIAALRQGAGVLVYPGGAQDVFRPYRLRDRIHLAGRKGFIKLALREGAPIVPLISWGAHDTLIVLADCYEQARQLHQWGLLPWLGNVDPEVFPIYLGLPWGLALGPMPHIPWPVQIHTRVCEPIVFDRYGRQAASDLAYVDGCYRTVVDQMQQALDKLVRECRQGSGAIGHPLGF